MQNTLIMKKSLMLLYVLFSIGVSKSFCQMADTSMLTNGDESVREFDDMKKLSMNSSEVVDSPEFVLTERKTLFENDPLSKDGEYTEESGNNDKKARRKIGAWLSDKLKIFGDWLERGFPHWEVTGRVGYMNHVYTNAPDLNGFGLNVALGANYLFKEPVDAEGGLIQNQFFLKFLCGYAMTSRRTNMVNAEMHSMHVSVSQNYLWNIPYRFTRKIRNKKRMWEAHIIEMRLINKEFSKILENYDEDEKKEYIKELKKSDTRPRTIHFFPIQTSIGAGPYFDWVMTGKNKHAAYDYYNFDMAHYHAMVVGAHVSAEVLFPFKVDNGNYDKIGLYAEYGFGFNTRFKGRRENYWTVGLALNF